MIPSSIPPPPQPWNFTSSHTVYLSQSATLAFQVLCSASDFEDVARLSPTTDTFKVEITEDVDIGSAKFHEIKGTYDLPLAVGKPGFPRSKFHLVEKVKALGLFNVKVSQDMLF
jgi:hypothetical protein